MPVPPPIPPTTTGIDCLRLQAPYTSVEGQYGKATTTDGVVVRGAAIWRLGRSSWVEMGNEIGVRGLDLSTLVSTWLAIWQRGKFFGLAN